jgi:hypothetical protein
MLLIMIALGGTLLGATTIAGLLMMYQIRQSADLRDSNMAIFAADAGLEMVGYTTRFPNQEVPSGVQYLVDGDGKRNGAFIDKIICYSTTTDPGPANIMTCENDGSSTPALVRSYGSAGRSNRAFQQ